jgi:hypothetical protein
VPASRKDLVRAAQLRPELAAEYAELEAQIGHRFRNDLSMADINHGRRTGRPGEARARVDRHRCARARPTVVTEVRAAE